MEKLFRMKNQTNCHPGQGRGINASQGRGIGHCKGPGVVDSMHSKSNVDAKTFENIYHSFTAATQMQHIAERGTRKISLNVPSEVPKDIGVITLDGDCLVLESDSDIDRNKNPECLVVPETDDECIYMHDESDEPTETAQDNVILNVHEHTTTAYNEMGSSFTNVHSE